MEQLYADLDEAMQTHFKKVQKSTFVGSTASSKAAVGLALASVAGL
jgi:hypothetical protein